MIVSMKSLAALAAHYQIGELKRHVERNNLTRGVPSVGRRKTTSHARNLLRECERRKRQIAKGQLKKENELVENKHEHKRP